MHTGCTAPFPQAISTPATSYPRHSSSLMPTSSLPSRYLMEADGNFYGQSVANEAVNLEGKWRCPPRPRLWHSEVGLTFSNP